MNKTPLQQRGIVSLLVLLLVIVLCTGQTSGFMQSCPNAAHGMGGGASNVNSSPAQGYALGAFSFNPAFSVAATQVLFPDFNLSQTDCDLTSKLLQSSQLGHGSKLFPFLLLVLVVAVALRSLNSVRTTPNGFPPVPRWRYRPHLHFCVFNE